MTAENKPQTEESKPQTSSTVEAPGAPSTPPAPVETKKSADSVPKSRIRSLAEQFAAGTLNYSDIPYGECTAVMEEVSRLPQNQPEE